MKKIHKLRPVPLRLEELEARLAPAAPVGPLETFDTTEPGTLPANWSQWSNTATNAFGASSAQSFSPPNSLLVASPSASGMNARAWINTAQPANMQVEAAVYLDQPIPAEVLARGRGLNSATPSYYAVSVTEGLDLKLLRIQKGVTTTLGEVRSESWFANRWASVTLFANADNLRARIQRSDTGQYLNDAGQWQSAPTWALNLRDSSLAGGGEVGVGRLPSYTGSVYFDDFSYGELKLDSQPPTVTINAPAPGSTLSGVTQVQVGATDKDGVTRVEFYVDNVLRAVDTLASYSWSFDTTSVPNGSHTLTIKAYDPGQHRSGLRADHDVERFFRPAPAAHPAAFPQHPPERVGLQRRLVPP
jgi:hypothetical protein